jgi:predicted ATPase
VDRQHRLHPAHPRVGTCRSRCGALPPWPEPFASDAERRHDFAAAVAEHEPLASAYPALGYNVILLPKASVTERVSFVLERVTPD